MTLSNKQHTTLSLLRQLTSPKDWEEVNFGYYGEGLHEPCAFETFYLHQTSTNNLYTFSNPFKCIGKMKNTKLCGEYADFHRKYAKEIQAEYTVRKIFNDIQLKRVLEEMDISKWNPRSVMGKLDFDRRAEEDGITWNEEEYCGCLGGEGSGVCEDCEPEPIEEVEHKPNKYKYLFCESGNIIKEIVK
tara:strand:+ start:85 stop:648 length:564 start_codon:yes stop_codon:yes gene_type:complete